MVFKRSLPVLFCILFLHGCGQSLPDCASSEARDLLLKIIREKVTGSESGVLYIEPTFEIVNTIGRSNDKLECSAQIVFRIPAKYEVHVNKKIQVSYDIQKNELQKSSFSVSAKLNFQEIEDLNNQGWTANQNYLFKKANLEFLSDSYNDEVTKKLEDNPLAILALPALMESISFNKVNQKLIDAGWKFEGESKDDKSTVIYSKDNFTLSIKTVNNLALMLYGLTGPMIEDANIWER